MYKASVTSKGQVTIPKEVRELLDINTGDNITFSVDDGKNIVTVAKNIETINCSVCMASGEIRRLDGKEVFNCPVCRGEGQIKKEVSVFQEIDSLMKASLKYVIGITLVTHTEDGEKLIPEITLISKLYPQNILNLIQDYYQIRLIEEFAPKALEDQTKFMYPSDYVLDELLNLLKTDEAREKVRKWFRYTRSIVVNKGFRG